MSDCEEIIDFHQIIIDALGVKFPEYEHIGDYERIEETIPTPSVYINLAEFEEVNQNTGTQSPYFFADCHFEAFICLSALEEFVKVEIREKALKLASFINQNRFGSQVFMPAKFKLAQPDEFNPKFDGVEVWRVEWEQIITFIKS